MGKSFFFKFSFPYFFSATKRSPKDITLKIEAVTKNGDADGKSIKEYEAKLQLLVQEVEAARWVKLLSERKDSGAKITLSDKEFVSLILELNDSAKLADMKVPVAIVQVEVVKAFQHDSLEMLGARQKELEELNLAAAEALKTAGEAEADKMKLEGELERLHQYFLNKAEGVPNSKIHCEIEMDQTLSYLKGISKSHCTSSARRRVTLGEILKMDWEGKEKDKRAHMRSLSGLCRGM